MLHTVLQLSTPQAINSIHPTVRRPGGTNDGRHKIHKDKLLSLLWPAVQYNRPRKVITVLIMTLDEIVIRAKDFEIDSRGTAHHKMFMHLRHLLEELQHESKRIVPDPEAEWVTLENDEVSFGFQKCCEPFLNELLDGSSFRAFDHPSGKRPLIGTAARLHGHWELHYCPYCGVKINLQL